MHIFARAPFALFGRFLLLICTLALFIPKAYAMPKTPYRGDLDMLVVFCEYNNIPRDSRTLRMTKIRITMATNFWNERLGGVITIVPRYENRWLKMGIDKPKSGDPGRDVKYNSCSAAAKKAGLTPNGQGFPLYMIADALDGWWQTDNALIYGVDEILLEDKASKDKGSIRNNNWRGLAHEIGHALSLNHAQGNILRMNPFPAIPYADLYDVMGRNREGIIPFSREQLGTIAVQDIYSFGAYSTKKEMIITLRDPLRTTKKDMPDTFEAVRIPFDRKNSDRYLLVEFATKKPVGNQPISPLGNQPMILIYEVSNLADKYDDYGNRQPRNIYSTLLYDYRGECTFRGGSKTGTPCSDGNFLTTLKQPIVSADVKGVDVKIEILTGNFKDRTLTIKITNPHVNDCVAPYVHRLAAPDDFACVTSVRANETIQENSAAKGRTAAYNGQTPTRCKSGFVFRKTTPTDLACVTSGSIVINGRETSRHFTPQSKRLAWVAQGINACNSGLVWRLADSHDYVCTTQERFEAVQQENYIARNRTTDGKKCLPGFITRAAFAGDIVCVTPGSREQAQSESRKRTGNYRFRK